MPPCTFVRLLLPWALGFSAVLFSSAQCPAGYQCMLVFNDTATRHVMQCPGGTYSLQGWDRCCSLSVGLACGVKYPGHFALNSSCQCNRVACAVPQQDLIRNAPGRFICDARPSACQDDPPCATVSMVRERHTCNCLGLSYPCLSNEVLWGDRGGPFECLPLLARKK